MTGPPDRIKAIVPGQEHPATLEVMHDFCCPGCGGDLWRSDESEDALDIYYCGMTGEKWRIALLENTSQDIADQIWKAENHKEPE